jgi:hypothetical protein
MDANPNEIEDIRINHEKMNASQELTIAEMDAWLAGIRAWRKAMMAHQEVMETLSRE